MQIQQDEIERLQAGGLWWWTRRSYGSRGSKRGSTNRAGLQAQLLAQGFQQAQAAAVDLAARQGLGQFQTQLGQQQQAQEQAKLDAAQQQKEKNNSNHSHN